MPDRPLGTRFEASPELGQAIAEAQGSLASLRSCPGPPFWDGFNGWDERFAGQLERLIRLRSHTAIEACEQLEDTLAAVHDRRAEILRVTVYQLLLGLPPLRRRNRWSSLGQVDPGLLRSALSGVAPGRVRAALAEPGWPPSVREWVVQALPPELRPEAPDAGAPGAGPGPATRDLLHAVIRELAAAPCLLPTPPAWAGHSCFDLRLERLSGLAADHLGQWPDPEDLAIALAGCSEDNRRRALAGHGPGAARAVAERAGRPGPELPWRRILLAQRRITWWLGAVNFQSRVLDLYDALRAAPASGAEAILSAAGVSATVMDGVSAMAKAYPAPGRADQ